METKEIYKSIAVPEWIADAVQELADKERRSWARETQVLLEVALNRNRGLERPIPTDLAVPGETA